MFASTAEKLLEVKLVIQVGGRECTAGCGCIMASDASLSRGEGQPEGRDTACM